MRIAFLTHEPFYPPSGGGSAEALYLVRELVRRGHQIHVFCPDFPNSGEADRRFCCQFHLFKDWPMGRYARWRNMKYLLYPRRLERLVAQTSLGSVGHPPVAFDLLLAQHTISAVAAGRLRSRLQTPVILNYLDFLTGFMETWSPWAMPRPVVRALTRFELSLPSRYQVEGVMTVSHPLADRLAAAGYDGDKIHPILYGFDSERFQPMAMSPPAEDAPPLVVMHGSFDKHHLGPIAIDMLAEVWNQRREVRFRFIGRITDALRAFVHRVRQRCPGIQIELPGFIPYENISGYLVEADVGIIPYEESNGTHCAFVAKAVEYLGCGIPVASTPLENLTRYFADEPAVKFGRFDGRSLAKVVLEWLDRPRKERMNLGVQASRRVARELDWSTITQNAASFIESAGGGKQSNSR